MGCWVLRSCLDFLKVGDAALPHPYSICPSISTIIAPALANTFLLPVYLMESSMSLTSSLAVKTCFSYLCSAVFCDTFVHTLHGHLCFLFNTLLQR